MPCRVGLTGGLASGKSAVARILEEAGVPVLDADRVVHRLYRPGGDGARVVAELFGAAMLSAQGAVDRARLSDRMLADPGARAALEGAIHPLVRRDIRAWLGRQAAPVAVVEAALLVETGAYRGYDLLVVVWCEPEQQLERALARGMDRGRAERLMAAQASPEERRAVADVVIDNRGGRDELVARVRQVWPEVVGRCAQRAAGSSHSVS